MGFSPGNNGIIYTAFERVYAVDAKNTVTPVTVNHHGLFIGLHLEDFVHSVTPEPDVSDIAKLAFITREKQAEIGEPLGFYGETLQPAYCAFATEMSLRGRGEQFVRTRTVGSASTPQLCRELLQAYRDNYLLAYCKSTNQSHLLVIEIGEQVNATLFDADALLKRMIIEKLNSLRSQKIRSAKRCDK